GFEEQEYNELPYARRLAERYETEHHELIVKTDAATVLPLLVHHYNEPFADSSALPTYYVSKMTREHVTVALSGDGGDENFAGYNNYAAVMAWSKADAIPSPLRRVTGRTMSAVLDALPHGTQTARASRAFTMLAADVPERFRMQMTILKPQEKAAAYSERFHALAGEAHASAAREWTDEMDALDWMMRQDQSSY